MTKPAAFHCVMTIQSIWNSQPSAAITHTAVITGDTAQELYEEMFTQTRRAWGKAHYGTSMGTPVILHWSYTPNTLTPAVAPTAAPAVNAFGTTAG